MHRLSSLLPRRCNCHSKSQCCRHAGVNSTPKLTASICLAYICAGRSPSSPVGCSPCSGSPSHVYEGLGILVSYHRSLSDVLPPQPSSVTSRVQWQRTLGRRRGPRASMDSLRRPLSNSNASRLGTMQRLMLGAPAFCCLRQRIGGVVVPPDFLDRKCLQHLTGFWSCSFFPI
jgi:hypothetical protein